ncbi:MAG: 2-dehydropantoate 2-reductase [Myxococcales bacterium]|nr:2-dehydropantoate 2-reductase [Myxococcales bacterium]
MRIAIVGAGAVGLGIGSGLLAAGHTVRFATRTPEAADALLRDGVERSGLFGDVRIAPSRLEAGVGADALRGRAFEWMLVATKTPDAPACAEALARAWHDIGGAKRVVLAYNGWGAAEPFERALGARGAALYAARVITGFQRRSATRVEVTAHAAPVLVGPLGDAPPAPAADFCEAVASGGIPCEPCDDVERELWAKLLYNCALNPLGALIGVPYGALGANARTRAILEAVVAEIFALLDARGTRLAWPGARAYLEHFFRDLLPPTAAHESSMLQDLRAGRRTEIDALCGAVVRLAGELGLDAPVNRALWQLVRAREERRARMH